MLITNDPNGSLIAADKVLAKNGNEIAIAFTKNPNANIKRNNYHPWAQKHILNASVLLTQKLIGGTFTGSGVMLYVEGNQVFIATAKHNLYILKGDQNQPTAQKKLQEYADFFKDNINIFFANTQNVAFHEYPQDASSSINAKIDEVIPIYVYDANGQEKKDWTYDVAILTSTDSTLVAAAKKRALMNYANMKFVVGSTTQGPTYGEASSDLFLNKNLYNLIMTGFGDSRDSKGNPNLQDYKFTADFSKKLQYRFCEAKSTSVSTVYGESVDTSKKKGEGSGKCTEEQSNAITLHSDSNNQSAPGDSGGPLFAISKTGQSDEIYVLGVVLGGDFALTNGNTPPSPYDNNCCTSLEPYYRQVLEQQEPTITSIAPPTGVSKGDLVTVTGTNFLNNSDTATAIEAVWTGIYASGENKGKEYTETRSITPQTTTAGQITFLAPSPSCEPTTIYKPISAIKLKFTNYSITTITESLYYKPTIVAAIEITSEEIEVGLKHTIEDNILTFIIRGGSIQTDPLPTIQTEDGSTTFPIVVSTDKAKKTLIAAHYIVCQINADFNQPSPSIILHNDGNVSSAPAVLSFFKAPTVIPPDSSNFKANDTVIITGSNFPKDKSRVKVTINSEEASITNINDKQTSMEFTIPGNVTAGKKTLVVTNYGRFPSEEIEITIAE